MRKIVVHMQSTVNNCIANEGGRSGNHSRGETRSSLHQRRVPGRGHDRAEQSDV